MAHKRPEIQQIGTLIADLAKRCVDLDDKATASILYTVAGAIDENRTEELADVTAEYSMSRILHMALNKLKEMNNNAANLNMEPKKPDET